MENLELPNPSILLFDTPLSRVSYTFPLLFFSLLNPSLPSLFPFLFESHLYAFAYCFRFPNAFSKSHIWNTSSLLLVLLKAWFPLLVFDSLLVLYRWFCWRLGFHTLPSKPFSFFVIGFVKGRVSLWDPSLHVRRGFSVPFRLFLVALTTPLSFWLPLVALTISLSLIFVLVNVCGLLLLLLWDPENGRSEHDREGFSPFDFFSTVKMLL